MSYATVTAITGANKGIGLAIVRALAARHATTTASSFPSKENSKHLIYLTSRNPTLGQAAIDDLQKIDPTLFAPRGGPTTLTHATLDVTSSASISAFASRIAAGHNQSSHSSSSSASSVSSSARTDSDYNGQGLTHLINNAGIAGPTTSTTSQPLTPEEARSVLATNYHGLVATTLALLPHLRQPSDNTPSSSSSSSTPPHRPPSPPQPNPQITNLASTLGKLTRYPDHLATRFRTAASGTSISAITGLMDEFVLAVERGTLVRDGWADEQGRVSAYAVSKAGVVGVTRVLGRLLMERAEGLIEGGGKGGGRVGVQDENCVRVQDENCVGVQDENWIGVQDGTAKSNRKAKGRFVGVDCVCPGFLATDLTKGRGGKDLDAGAGRVVDVALGVVQQQQQQLRSKDAGLSGQGSSGDLNGIENGRFWSRGEEVVEW